MATSKRGGKARSPARIPRKITVPWVRDAARSTATRGGSDRPPLVMVTAYDYPQARIADAAGVDLVLVGDSLAMVVLGHSDTLSLTVEESLHHVKAVRRGTERALLVADMPYGSFHLGPRRAVDNALRFVKEGGAEAVKIEGARPEVVEALVAAEIPVMAHLGLTPQSLHRFGGFKVQGKDDDARRAVLEAAHAMEDAGAFGLVLECVPAGLAREVTGALSIPTIGIGAGPACHGQVLVFHDLLGYDLIEEDATDDSADRAPKFVRRYAETGRTSRRAVETFADDVRQGRFPAPAESYGADLPPTSDEPPTPRPGPATTERTDILETIYG